MVGSFLILKKGHFVKKSVNRKKINDNKNLTKIAENYSLKIDSKKELMSNLQISI